VYIRAGLEARCKLDVREMGREDLRIEYGITTDNLWGLKLEMRPGGGGGWHKCGDR
jgi:hypothetical protein